MGGLDVVLRRYANLTDHLRLYGDGEDLTNRIRQLRLEAICFLNIPSHGAGTNPWGTPPTQDQVSPAPLGSNLVISLHITPSQIPPILQWLYRILRIRPGQTRSVPSIRWYMLPRHIPDQFSPTHW